MIALFWGSLTCLASLGLGALAMRWREPTFQERQAQRDAEIRRRHQNGEWMTVSNSNSGQALGSGPVSHRYAVNTEEYNQIVGREAAAFAYYRGSYHEYWYPTGRRNCRFEQFLTHEQFIEAYHRSQVLLRSWLSPEQLAEYEQDQKFTVTSSSGKKYVIWRGTVSNIRELDDNNGEVASLCVQPEGAYWTGDVMLAQKIMLEDDEPELLRKANRTLTVVVGENGVINIG